jgi:hypothetical protein
VKRLAILVLLTIATSSGAQITKESLGYDPKNPNFADVDVWKEAQDISLPPYPADENLVEVDVSPVATNAYYIDSSTLAPGNDGVIRYVLVVKTSGGATNVSFEGIHCRERNWKHFASGRSDKTWAKSQALRQDWKKIENKPLNPVHAILSRDFFCPLGSPIASAEEGRQALRLGKHPLAN